MVVVNLSAHGGPRWYVQRFISGLHTPCPMVIPNCGRCLGVFIFWKALKSPNYTAVTAIHIPPGHGKYMRTTSKEIRKILRTDLEGFQPYFVTFSGGKIDTPQNRFFYRQMIRKYITPYQHLFSEVQIGVFYPENDTALTTVYMDKELNISIRRKVYQATA